MKCPLDCNDIGTLQNQGRPIVEMPDKKIITLHVLARKNRQFLMLIHNVQISIILLSIR